MKKDAEKKLLIIGATPISAGVGGVTVHVERLMQYLESLHFPFDHFDYKTQSLLGVVRQVRKAGLVHLHVCNPYYMFLLTIVSIIFHKKLIITLHGKYVEGEQKPWALISFAIRRCSVPIVLNNESFDTCIKLNPHTKLIPAFIPPQKKEMLDEKIVDVVNEIHKNGRKAVVTYGYDEYKDVFGKEIYGISFLLPFFNNNPKYTLVVSNPTGTYKVKYSKDYPNIVFLDGALPLYELLKITDIFVRNTSKDGDSLSVKEGLYLGKQVICTDVVNRPEGTQLFGYCDEVSLQKCLDTGLSLTDTTVKSGEKEIVQLYQDLIE